MTSHINRLKGDFFLEIILNLVQAVKFASDAARGMQYLARKHVIHRDLAARNCLLENLRGSRRQKRDGTMSQKQTINLRIADFGLSKHLEDHYSEIGNYE